VAYRLINFEEIRHLISKSNSETPILIATFPTGILTELDFAILVGVVVSLCVFLHESVSPIMSVGAPTIIGGRRVFMNAHAYDLPECPRIVTMRLDGSLFFASVEYVLAHQKGLMALSVRTIGFERAKIKIGMVNLADNMRRLVRLDTRSAPA